MTVTQTPPADRRPRAAAPATRRPVAAPRLVSESAPPAIGVGTVNLSARAKALVLEALNNNRLSYGPMSQRFEAEFARQHNCRFGILSNSGTSALQVAVQALKETHGWQDGDEIIVPAVTFVATANVVLHNRLLPVLVDVEPRYYALDPAQLEAKITPRTRAIIPVHLFGHPADMAPLLAIAARHNLKVIEDSCETMFASYNGQRVGSLGDIGCFSTYVAHLLMTGVGGLNTTNDPEYAIRLRSLINHGRDSIYLSIDDDQDKTGAELRMIIARRFKFISAGHSFRSTEMEAALGLAQLEEWEPMIAARRANGRLLRQKLAHFDFCLQLPSQRPGSDHSYMMFPIVLRDEPKTDLVNFLEQNGVETRDMLPLTNQPVYQRLLGWREDDYPVARWINQNGFYVGCHQDLGEIELDHIAELFERYFRRHPTREREGACLVVSAPASLAEVEPVLAEIPRDLFERVLICSPAPDLTVRQRLESDRVSVLEIDPDQVLAQIARGELAVEQDNIVFFAADGRHNPRDVGRLLLALERGHDMVVASRFLYGGARQDREQRLRYRSIGNRVFTLLANLFYFGNASDALQMFRAVRRRRLVERRLRFSGLAGFYELSLHAMQSGWKVAEVPTVELVPPALHDQRRILASLPPLVTALLTAMRRRK